MSQNLTSASAEITVSPDSTTFTITIIQVIYGLPSFIFLIFFFIFLGLGKNYSGSFYRMVQFDLLTNIATYANTWIAIRLLKYPSGIMFLKGLESIFPGILTWSVYLTGWFMHMQFLSAAALSFHRITSVIWHHSYERVWSRYYPLFGLLVCIYSTLCEAILPGKTIYYSIVDGVLTQSRDAARGGQAMGLIAYFSVFYFLLLATVNSCTAYFVARKFKAANMSDRGVGRKLTKIAITYCFISIGIIFWTVTTLLNARFQLVKSLFAISLTLLSFVSDLMTLALPYILFLYDTNVKNDLCIGKNKHKVSSVVVSIGPTSKSLGTTS